MHKECRSEHLSRARADDKQKRQCRVTDTSTTALSVPGQPRSRLHQAASLHVHPYP